MRLSQNSHSPGMVQIPLEKLNHILFFVSVDGQGFKSFLDETTDTSAVFTGGKTKIRIFCVAKDTAGNVENQAVSAEASTVVVSLMLNQLLMREKIRSWNAAIPPRRPSGLMLQDRMTRTATLSVIFGKEYSESATICPQQFPCRRVLIQSH